MAPLATPWVSATNPCPWDLGDDNGETNCGCSDCPTEAFVKGEVIIINL